MPFFSGDETNKWLCELVLHGTKPTTSRFVARNLRVHLRVVTVGVSSSAVVEAIGVVHSTASQQSKNNQYIIYSSCIHKHPPTYTTYQTLTQMYHSGADNPQCEYDCKKLLTVCPLMLFCKNYIRTFSVVLKGTSYLV